MGKPKDTKINLFTKGTKLDMTEPGYKSQAIWIKPEMLITMELGNSLYPPS